jgi:hypothetical protein
MLCGNTRASSGAVSILFPACLHILPPLCASPCSAALKFALCLAYSYGTRSPRLARRQGALASLRFLHGSGQQRKSEAGSLCANSERRMDCCVPIVLGFAEPRPLLATTCLRENGGATA